MNDIDYEDFYNQAHLEQLKLLKESGLDSVSDGENIFYLNFGNTNS